MSARKPKNTQSDRFELRCSEDLRRALDVVAAKEGESSSVIARRALREYVARYVCQTAPSRHEVAA